MEIVIKPSRSGETRLSNLSVGKMFKLPAGNTVYIKLYNHYKPHNIPSHTVVNLANGNCYEYEDRVAIEMEGTLTAWEVLIC